MNSALLSLSSQNDRLNRNSALSLAELALNCAFQPIVHSTTGDVFGFETLMRGQDALGYATPLQMLDTAYTFDFLLDVEMLVIEKAVRKFVILPNHGSKTLFINLDSRSIPKSHLLVNSLLRILEKANLPPSSICFELSERFDNTEFENFPILMNLLRRSGFKIAIDDFGAGQGEFKLLCEYDVDYVKIDRFLVNNIHETSRKRHLFRNIVAIAHQLGIKVIAEGVETKAEYALCRELGADLVQGWFIEKPLTDIALLRQSYPELGGQAADSSGVQSLDEMLIRRNIESVPTVDESDPVEKVFEIFRRFPLLHYLPVLNASGEPRGVINEYHLKDLVYHPFGRDLLKNKFYGRTISHYVEPAPIMTLTTDTERMMEAFINMEGSECILVTENLKYSGLISAAALIKVINEKQLKIAQDQNPLTGLPGNSSIREYLGQSARDQKRERFYCYCDFDNFKPFNDLYGFHLGDTAISLFSAIIRKYFFRKVDFVGHVGGDDFFIGVNGWNRDELLEILDRLLSEFNDEVARLYSEQDREAGGITSLDRSGDPLFFAIMRCSIGVLHLPLGVEVVDETHISAAIVAVKSAAKKSKDGLVLFSLDQADEKRSA